MNLLKFTGLILLGFAASGCATIIKGTTQSISVNTPPTEGAKCTLTNSQGTWYLTSPGSVVVHKTKSNLKVMCAKDGYQDASASVSPTFNGVTFGNIIAGGIIGVGVDAASGANYQYPSLYSLPMTPVPTVSPVVQPLPDTNNGNPTS